MVSLDLKAKIAWFFFLEVMRNIDVQTEMNIKKTSNFKLLSYSNILLKHISHIIILHLSLLNSMKFFSQ